MKKRMKKIILLAVFVITIISLVGCSSDKKDNTSQNSKSIQSTSNAKVFPKFQGEDFEGNTVDEKVFSKHPVTVVNLWFAGCKACVDEMPDLEKISAEFQKKNVKMLGIDIDSTDDKEEVKKLLKAKGVTYQNLMLKSDKEIDEFLSKISAFPTTFLINRKGEIVGEAIEGAINSPKRIEEINRKIDEIIGQDK
ncbi:hypothetical protein N072000002_13950 [Clostridium tetani]|uniref:Thioredoxin domain-containing protein n=1 Tax=Clostridium tetani TaxID=1513 RepID=A0ABC8EED5_CLOTA|nr:TlpA disulfide reductase family protein [Clostridium tetani]BDR81215.1 hypothetical protein K234311028_14610 [Clostridium tetani]BDR89594.1 hypothetical protein N072000002_13950 [Clostridium tetani]